MRPFKPWSFRKGFTLIEVATALAIFTFAIVGIISLIPMAIVTHREAVGNTIIAQITQQLTGEAQMCGPAQFATYNNQQWYFDYEGNQVTAGTTGIVYRAQTTVASVQLSGQATSPNCLRLVQIYAAFDPTPTGTILSGLVTQGTPNGVVIVNQPTALAGGL